MTNVIDLKPSPIQDTTICTVRSCGDVFEVTTTLYRDTKRGFQIIIHVASEKMVLARTCAEGDDPRIVDAAIEGWRAGVRRGRQQMCEEAELSA